MSAQQFETIFGFALMDDPQLDAAIEVLAKGTTPKVRLPLEKTAHDPWYREFV